MCVWGGGGGGGRGRGEVGATHLLKFLPNLIGLIGCGQPFLCFLFDLGLMA